MRLLIIFLLFPYLAHAEFNMPGQRVKAGTTLYNKKPNPNSIDLFASNNPFTVGNPGRIRMHERMTWPDNINLGANQIIDSFMTISSTLTSSNNVLVFTGFDFKPTIQYSTAQIATFAPAFSSHATWQPTGSLTDTAGGALFLGFSGSPAYVPSGTSITPTTNDLVGFRTAPSINTTGGASSATVNNLTGYGSYYPSVTLDNFAPYIGASAIIGTLRHFVAQDPLTTAGYSLTNQVGLDIIALSKATNNYGVRSTIAAGSNNYFLYDSGGAASYLSGHIDTHGTAPTVANNACGTTVQGTVTSKSTDVSGSLTVGTLAVTSCAITFNTTWANAPNCVVTDDSNIIAVKSVSTTTTLTISSVGSMSLDKLSYICIGNE